MSELCSCSLPKLWNSLPNAGFLSSFKKNVKSMSLILHVLLPFYNMIPTNIVLCRSNAILHPGIVAERIIKTSLDPLRAKKTFIRKKLGHTAVSAIKVSLKIPKYFKFV